MSVEKFNQQSKDLKRWRRKRIHPLRTGFRGLHVEFLQDHDLSAGKGMTENTGDQKLRIVRLQAHAC